MGGLGWGVLMGGIGEDSFGRTWAGLQLHGRRLRTWGQKGAGWAPRSCGGARWTDAALSLRDNKEAVLFPCTFVSVWFMFNAYPQCYVRQWEVAELCCEKLCTSQDPNQRPHWLSKFREEIYCEMTVADCTFCGSLLFSLLLLYSHMKCCFV